MNRQELVVSELGRIYRGSMREGRDNVVILCPFHTDNSPSCSVNINPGARVPVGVYHCWSCGASGTWNKLAAKLGLAGFEDLDEVQETYMPRINVNLLSADTMTMEDLAQEFGGGILYPFANNDEWRGIRGSVMNFIGARKMLAQGEGQTSALLPVAVNGVLRGGIKASYGGNEKKKYLYNGGSWIADYGLFPFDTVKDMLRSNANLVLVEGPRDALRLIANDIPAIAILGANAWTEEKRDRIIAMARGLVICMDGDDAGVRASNKVSRDLRRIGIPYKVMKLKTLSDRTGSKVDPGNMPMRLLNSLKNFIGGGAWA